MVGVMGSATAAGGERSQRLGRWLAEIGVHLLTGGGMGTMETVCRAFAETPGRRGLVIGVLPGLPAEPGEPPRPPEGYPNQHVEIAIRTHLPALGPAGAHSSSRNHLNVLTSDVVVALPGAAGTASEVALALHYSKPVVAFVDAAADIEGLPAAARVEPDFGRVQDFVRRHLPDLAAG